MKTGKSLTELAQEIERQRQARRDYVVDTRAIEVTPERQIVLPNGTAEPMGIKPMAHRQIAAYTGVPAAFYDRLATEYPAEWAGVVNAILHNTPERRMVRALDGRARAFLSDRYRRLDHAEMLEHVFPVLQEFDGLRVESCEITDARMYLKLVYPKIEGEVGKGDVVQAGVVISNSEVGHGSFKIEQLVYRLVCLNGLIMGSTLRQNHVGRRVEEEGLLFADDTLAADDKALALKTRDVLRQALSPASFEDVLAGLRDAKAQELVSPVKAVEVLADTLRLTQMESDSVLRHLITGADLSRWGLTNAVTRAAQDVDSYDRSTELEQLGGRVLTLRASEWREVAQAA